MEEPIRVWQSEGFPGIVFYRGVGVTRRHPRHWHEELHICLYSSGQGYIGNRGNTIAVAGGDLVVTAPGEVHENWLAENASMDFRSAYFDGSVIKQAAEQIHETDRSAPEFPNMFPRDPELIRRFICMYRSMELSHSCLRQQELLLNFLHRLMVGSSTTDAPSSRSNGERIAVHRVRSYIEEHFSESIALSGLASIAKLSAFHLHRMFCLETGMPPHAYLTQVRINRAKSLLRRRLPLSEIAAAVGFADQSHFTRHFRKVVGVTPGQYASR